MFVKLVLFAALVMIVITLVKRGKSSSSSTPVQPELDKTMKRCSQCGVHLPETEALTYQTLHFCCNDHKKTYLEDKDI